MIDEKWKSKFMSKPGWQKERIDNMNALLEGSGLDGRDLIQDGWTSSANLLQEKLNDASDTSSFAEKKARAEIEHMEQVRARVDTIVENKETAEALKPWYALLCKRPTFHDEYLQTFNRANVTLVDTSGQGIQAFTKRGIVVNGREYEIDCLCLATGFEVSFVFYQGADGATKRKTQANGFEIIGKNGLSLAEKWADGPRTLNAYNTRGFPNLWIMNGPQAVVSANFVTLLEVCATHAAHMIGRIRKEGKSTVEPTQEAEDAYCMKVYEGSEEGQRFYAQCTPGYYNNEGKVTFSKTLAANYPGGGIGGSHMTEFFNIFATQQKENRAFEGFEVN